MRIKRTLYFLTATLALLFFTFAAHGEGRPFITKWKGEAGKELKIPIFGFFYKLVIKKASDNSELKTEASLIITQNDNFYTYTPTEDGEILVEAGPEGVGYIRFVYEESKRGSAENLLTVEQFGTVVWKSMYDAFQYCRNMQFAPTVDTPDLSNVTDMQYMFSGCRAFNQALSSWNVSNVKDMDFMFRGCSAFNQDLSSWNVSNVTDMEGMFEYCSSFNQDLSSWNVSNVTSMEGMFYDCSAFNQNLGSWTLKKCKKLGLQNCGMSVENYSKSLEGWAAQADINEKLVLRADGHYFNETGKSARTKLIKEKHWSIIGDVSEGGRVYDLYVGGVQLSTDNINTFQDALTEAGVLKKGKVSVTLEGEKLVLLLENAELTAPYNEFPISMLWSGNNEIIIQLQGVSTITQLSSYDAAIFVHKGTIVGRKTNDKLLVKGGNVYFSTAIRNCTVEIEKELNGGYSSALEIDNAVVKAKRITRVSPLTLKNCSILQPEGAHYDAAKEEVVDKDGNTAENVVIGRTGAVTGVKLAYNDLTLKTGDSFTLLATVEPANATNKAVTWSSDNDAVATVSDAGVVEAKAVGTANITVTTEDGSHTATCEVTVTIPVTGVSLSQTELSLSKGGTATLTATVAPPDATNKNVTWSSNNTAVATVENGTVTAVSEGNATITVTTEDGSHTATCEVTVTIPVTGVSLSQTELSLSKGGTATLTATVAPPDAANKNVTWSSNNTEVATVEDGTVTAVAGGKAQITVTTEDGNYTATCHVIVKLSDGSEPVDVTGVKLFPATLPLKQGTSHTLIASVEPANATNKAVTWSSSNEAVASVSDKGVVEAKTVGTATITVTTKDGGHTAICEVNVTVEDVVLTGLTISPSEVSVEANKEVTLSVSFEPVSATHKGVKWSSNDPTIATVDEHGKVKGIAAGETTITAVSEKYESVTNICKVTVISPTAVEDAEFANVIVSPNPFETQLRLSNGDVRGKYALYNTQGLEVASGALEGVETRINTASFPAGMYLLRLTSENGAVKTYRVVKQ